MGVVSRRWVWLECIGVVIIIITVPYSTCISSFLGRSIPISLFIFIFSSLYPVRLPLPSSLSLPSLLFDFYSPPLFLFTLSCSTSTPLLSFKKNFFVLCIIIIYNYITRKQTCNGEYTKHCTRSIYKHQLKMAAPAEVSEKRSLSNKTILKKRIFNIAANLTLNTMASFDIYF